ncbi:MAG TPA: arginase family protein [Vicinamibacteria bacterium]|nr:arginase family protein [Vicinamibacteria bacterium]
MLRDLGVVVLGLVSTLGWAQEHRYRDSDGRIRVAPVKMPYSGARNVPEISPVPDYLEAGGIVTLLEELGAKVKDMSRVALTPEEENDYGEWHRLGLANNHLGEMVAANERDGYLTIGLLANCSSLTGVLGGLQDSGPTRRPRKVGLVFIDAHGDFNTPETTLSGMLGGMPVAVSAGMCLRNLRMESGLDPALPTRYIVMAAVRDTDPLEQELIDRSEIEMITVDDIRKRSENIHAQMERLSSLVDLIYIHIDMDVLDPREVSGHPLTVPDGPTSQELADALAEMFRYEKAAALGIASTPSGERDPDGLSRQAAYNLVRGAIRGIKERK